MGVQPRPLLPRILTSDLPASSNFGNLKPGILDDERLTQPRNDGMTESLDVLLRRFAEGGMKEETLKLLVQAKLKEDEVSFVVQRLTVCTWT